MLKIYGYAKKKKSSQKSAVVLQKTDIFNVCVFFFAFSTRTLNSGIFKLYMCEEKNFMLNLFL